MRKGRRERERSESAWPRTSGRWIGRTVVSQVSIIAGAINSHRYCVLLSSVTLSLPSVQNNIIPPIVPRVEACSLQGTPLIISLPRLRLVKPRAEHAGDNQGSIFLFTGVAGTRRRRAVSTRAARTRPRARQIKNGTVCKVRGTARTLMSRNELDTKPSDHFVCFLLAPTVHR